MQASLEINIRLADPEDARAIAKVLYESFVEYEALYTPEGFAATTPDADQVKTRMREGPVWITCRDDAVLGTVAAKAKGPVSVHAGNGGAALRAGLGSRLSIAGAGRAVGRKPGMRPRISQHHTILERSDPA